MAKGARASTRKANNVNLKTRVFGPVEKARTERLSAKLLELASQPKKREEDAAVVAPESSAAQADVTPAVESTKTDGMEIDQDSSKTASKPASGRGRIEKRRSSSRKASIVFPKFKDGKRVVKSKGKK